MSNRLLNAAQVMVQAEVNNFLIICLLCFCVSLEIQAQNSIVIRNVNVVDVQNGKIEKGRFVEIKDGVIRTISKKNLQIEADLEIDGTGKYLAPGLVNMYTHVNEDNLILYLANGQTTIKDAPSHLTALGLRDRIRDGELVGPRIFAVGLRATGMPAPYQSQQPVRTADEAVFQVQEAKRLGYDGMFIYGSCDPDTYLPILQEAQNQDLQITGHFPQNVPLADALNNVQKAFDNLTGLTRRGVLRVDREELITGLIENGQAITPTLTIHRLWSLSHRNDSIYEAIPKEYIPNKMKSSWTPVANGSGDYPYHEVTDLISEMYQRGVQLFIGSDGGFPMVVNGFSYHQELENFSKLGIQNKDILRIATINSAEFLGYSDLGLVKEGYLADLLLLDNNPLRNLENLKEINYVFVQGQVMSSTVLSDELNKLKNRLSNERDRFDHWENVIVDWDPESILEYEFRNNNVLVGEEKIRVVKESERTFTLESINVMDGPDFRETYMYASIINRRMDSLHISSITPEGTYTASISTTKTSALITGAAPFHGEFAYEENLEAGTLLLGPFTSRYFELDIMANYMLGMMLKRSRLEDGGADQLPVIQIELNSEEFGKNLIVDNSDFTILRENQNQYKIIYNTFSGYRSITASSFVVNVKLNDKNTVEKISSSGREIRLKAE